MAPSNSRPPLASRIRASFEGKRPKPEELGPKLNGQDTETLRAAIDQALNTDYFQGAIANHLAKLLMRSIKTALDTLQPVVETVYSHEVLLKQTNQSVENILQRLATVTEEPSSKRTSWIDPVRSHPVDRRPDTLESYEPPTPRGTAPAVHVEEIAQVSWRVAELARRMDLNNSRLSETADKVALIHASLTPTAQGMKSIQAYAEESNTNISVMQAQLDQAKTDIGHLVDVVPSDLAKCVKSIRTQVVGQDPPILAAHTTKLDGIATELGALKASATGMGDVSPDVATKLNALKAQVEAGFSSNNEHFDNLTWRLSNISTAMEGHIQVLTDIQEADASADILRAAQKANELYTSHTTTLEEIKANSTDSHADLVKAIEALAIGGAGGMAAEAVKSDSGDSTAALLALATDLSSLKENIQGGFTANNSGLSGLGTKIDDVRTTLEAHRVADQGPAILEGLQKSNDSHAAYTSALDEIKASGTAPASEGASTINLAPLETQVGAIITTLDAHSMSLNELKSSSAVPAAQGAPMFDLDPLDTKVSTIITTLDAHTASLEEIKVGKSESAYASEGFDLSPVNTHLTTIIDTLGTHSSTLDDIKTAGVSREPAAFADLTDVHTHLNYIVDTLGFHRLTSDEIIKARNVPEVVPHFEANMGTHIGGITTILSTHTSLLDEIKQGDVSAEILTLLHDCKELHAGHNVSLAELKAADVSAEILTALHSSHDSHEKHAASLDDLKAAVSASNDSHATHTSTLAEIQAIGGGASASGGQISLEGVETKIDSIVASLEGQSVFLSDIQEATAISNNLHTSHAALLTELKEATTASNDFHANHTASLTAIEDTTAGLKDLHFSHTATLGDIKDATSGVNETLAANALTLVELKETSTAANNLHASHVTALNELKAAPTSASEGESLNVAGLETQIGAIIATLDAQSSTLTDIAAATSDSVVLEAVKQTQGLLSTHNATLESIKEDTSHADILESLAALKTIVEESRNEQGGLINDLHENTQLSHSNLKTSLMALAAEGGAGALVAKSSESDNSLNKELLEKVKEVHIEVKESSSTLSQLASQFEINTTTLTTSINTLSDELKAELDASSTEIASAVGTLSSEVKGIELQSLSDAVGECAREMRGLSENVDAVDGRVRELDDGMHFSEKGVGQLREHLAGVAVATPVIIKEMEENSHIEKVLVEMNPPVDETPIEEATRAEESAPVEEIPVEDAPIEEPPVEIAQSSVEQNNPTEETPVDDTEPVMEEAPIAESGPLPGKKEAGLENIEDSESVVEPESIQKPESAHEPEMTKEIESQPESDTKEHVKSEPSKDDDPISEEVPSKVNEPASGEYRTEKDDPVFEESQGNEVARSPEIEKGFEPESSHILEGATISAVSGKEDHLTLEVEKDAVSPLHQEEIGGNDDEPCGIPPPAPTPPPGLEDPSVDGEGEGGGASESA